MVYTIEAACCSKAGDAGRVNGDNLYFFGKCLEPGNKGLRHAEHAERELSAAECFAVFGGPGGSAATFAAARELKKQMAEQEEYLCSPSVFLRRAVTRINAAVCSCAPDSSGISAVILYLSGEQIYVCSVGGKACRLRDSGFIQLSRGSGRLLKPAATAKKWPFSARSAANGGEAEEAEPHIAKGTLRRGDIYLLCSEGLTAAMSNIELCCGIHDGESLSVCTEELLSAALRKGLNRDATAILIGVK